MEVPAIVLPSTGGRSVNLREEAQSPTVLFCYPRTGELGKSSPADWDIIPGARGCHHHYCGFRNLHEEFRRAGCQVFAVSTQPTAYQAEFLQRLHIPFEALSDAKFEFATALRLPTFEYAGQPLLRRLTLVLHRGRVAHVFYPVFPPDQNADVVLRWIRTNPTVLA